jgi:membrane protein implicated in regulation of membrane protease activity
MEMFGLDSWLAWFLIGIALMIIEVAIAFTFYAAPVALGAFAAAIVAALGAELEIQLVAFIVGALLSLAFLRPLVRQHLSPPEGEKASNVQSLLGRRAIALERVDVDAGTVRLGDDVWSARTLSEAEVIDEGARVEVVEVRGVFAYVRAAALPDADDQSSVTAEEGNN